MFRKMRLNHCWLILYLFLTNCCLSSILFFFVILFYSHEINDCSPIFRAIFNISNEPNYKVFKWKLHKFKISTRMNYFSIISPWNTFLFHKNYFTIAVIITFCKKKTTYTSCNWQKYGIFFFIVQLLFNLISTGNDIIHNFFFALSYSVQIWKRRKCVFIWKTVEWESE